ncbi:MAG: DUF448 domain-containing protein [Pseudomonadota bacterium]
MPNLSMLETARERRAESGGQALHMSAKAIPERRCVLTGETAVKPRLFRFALAPDGTLTFDLKQKLPGRGLYILPDRAVLEKAVAKGKLRGLAARHFKIPAADIAVSPDLVNQIEALMRQRALSVLGLERKAGRVFVGADAVEKAAQSGKASVLINASDGAGDSGKFRARAVEAGIPVITDFNRTDLSLALGRENVVHAALSQRGAWQTLLELAEAYGAFVNDRRSDKGSSVLAERDKTREGP